MLHHQDIHRILVKHLQKTKHQSQLKILQNLHQMIIVDILQIVIQKAFKFYRYNPSYKMCHKIQIDMFNEIIQES